MKFIIYTYSFDIGIGGIKVMHKLCHLLNFLGYESYLYPINNINGNFYTYDKYNTPIVDENVLENIKDYVIIYPEGIPYNPLDGKKIIRWILGPPDKKVYKTWKKTDILYWYADLYKCNELWDLNNNLFIIEFHEDIFYNKNYPRNGSCYTFRKKEKILHTISQYIHEKDSIFIEYNDAGNLHYLSELFNTCNVFYCYDTYTFLSIQATMCGCNTIIVPDLTISKEKWINSQIIKYGIAYGFDDFIRIEKTKNQFLLSIENIQSNTLKTIENLIKTINK